MSLPSQPSCARDSHMFVRLLQMQLTAVPAFRRHFACRNSRGPMPLFGIVNQATLALTCALSSIFHHGKIDHNRDIVKGGHS
mmetsp:Transcript_5367/g.14528  ORF Transcript_5367/g.14528 Transcript_5367/m.14528 type:complete len:82 (-) Transcript_5367:630-875(-)